MEHFRYFGKNLTNQNSIQEGSKCRLKSQNACYCSVQNLLSSSLLFKNIKIKVYKSTVFLLFGKGVKLGQNKKKTTRLPLLTHSLNCHTCNPTLKRKRRDNFSDIRECIFGNNWFIFMKEMSVLARNNCYILPYYQGTDPCGEVKYFAKYSLTASLSCGGTDRRSRVFS